MAAFDRSIRFHSAPPVWAGIYRRRRETASTVDGSPRALRLVERFFGILIEHYAGAFPVWLAPVQAVVLPITDKQNEYAREVKKRLADAGIRAELDDRSEKVNLKIREAQLQKVPYMLVVGGREAEAGQVSVRNRKHGDQGVKSVDEFLASMKELIEQKTVAE